MATVPGKRTRVQFEQANRYWSQIGTRSYICTPINAQKRATAKPRSSFMTLSPHTVILELLHLLRPEKHDNNQQCMSYGEEEVLRQRLQCVRRYSRLKMIVV